MTHSKLTASGYVHLHNQFQTQLLEYMAKAVIVHGSILHQAKLLPGLVDGIQAFQKITLPTVSTASDKRANRLRGTAMSTTSPAPAANITVPRWPALTKAGVTLQSFMPSLVK